MAFYFKQKKWVTSVIPDTRTSSCIDQVFLSFFLVPTCTVFLKYGGTKLLPINGYDSKTRCPDWFKVLESLIQHTHCMSFDISVVNFPFTYFTSFLLLLILINIPHTYTIHVVHFLCLYLLICLRYSLLYNLNSLENDFSKVTESNEMNICLIKDHPIRLIIHSS